MLHFRDVGKRVDAIAEYLNIEGVTLDNQQREFIAAQIRDAIVVAHLDGIIARMGEAVANYDRIKAEVKG